MCGIAGVFGAAAANASIDAMVAAQHHRGPDGSGVYRNGSGTALLGHNRLAIIDLSDAGRQPMSSGDGRYRVSFNGEIYNYLELRRELEDGYRFASQTDTEVILAAYERWGAACLDRFLGMFAFVVWDEQERMAFAARDRFGVKPLHFHQRRDGSLLLASEIKALHAAGVERTPDVTAWSTYLRYGLSDASPRTFWKDIQSLPPGHSLTWRSHQVCIRRWYDLADHVGTELDERPADKVFEEYRDLMLDSVRLRFRADVPVGVNLSGGLDSSSLLGAIHAVQGEGSDITAYTYATGEAAYDELPWVAQMLRHTRHRAAVCALAPHEVPALAESLQSVADEPCGGLPNVAYARLFDRARADGTIVLLDGQGMDEQWAGYDYYQTTSGGSAEPPVQGTSGRPVRPECLTGDFLDAAEPLEAETPFADRLRNAQYRDLRYTKMPKALRFNDRASMRASTELREPFLDHRLFELAFRQPSARKIAGGTRKWFLREVARRWLPATIVEAPKRPVSTPQREWIRGPLRGWVDDCIQRALRETGGAWLDRRAVGRAWAEFQSGAGDNSLFIWQWVSLGMLLGSNGRFAGPVATAGAVRGSDCGGAR